MNLLDAALATLTYHDIFDYPLTKEEAFLFLIDNKSSQDQVAKELQSLIRSKKVSLKENYFFLKGRREVVRIRKSRTRYSRAKFQKARFFVNILQLIPSIKFIGISGALAMQNSDKNDDIDLFIVTSKNLLWTTRFLASIALWPFRRRPNEPHKNNKACLNIFIDESHLKIKTQNLYTAHEICQMKPYLDRDGTYQRFVNANSWVKNYLPNWESTAKRQTQNAKRKKKVKDLDFRPLALVTRPLEALAKWGQLNYMRKKITTEKINNHQLFFHPANTQEYTLKEFKNKLKNHNLRLEEPRTFIIDKQS